MRPATRARKLPMVFVIEVQMHGLNVFHCLHKRRILSSDQRA